MGLLRFLGQRGKNIKRSWRRNRLRFFNQNSMVRNYLSYAHTGISSHVRPSKSRPAFFLLVPPHCLKKNATPASRHCSLSSVTHSGFMGLAPGPDSPPTMTQSIFSKFKLGKGPSKGSNERNFTFAPVWLK